MVFCRRISSGPRLHVEDVGVGKELAQEIGHGDLVGRAPVDRLADGAERLREHLDGMVRRHVTRPEMHLRGAHVVAGDEAMQDLGKEAALLGPEAPHDAEVDRHQPPVSVDEQVARVHVGMKEAVAHGVLQEGAHHGEAEGLAVDAGGRQPRIVGEAHAVNPLDRQHAARGSLPIDLGNAEIVVALGILGHLRNGRRLEAKIHLELGRALQGVDDGNRLEAPHRRVEPLDLTGREVVAVEIAPELPLDAGAQDLYGHLATVPIVVDDGCLVDLRDRGGGNRWAEFSEMIFELAAERLFDGLPRLGHGERRQVVLQLRQLPRELGPDDIGARGEKLAELDIAGP